MSVSEVQPRRGSENKQSDADVLGRREEKGSRMHELELAHCQRGIFD